MNTKDFIILNVYRKDLQLLDSVFNTNHKYDEIIYPTNVLMTNNLPILFHSHAFVVWDKYELLDFQTFKKQFSKLVA
jgi:hypothetical protein